MEKYHDLSDQVIVTRRRSLRAFDLHSSKLVGSHGLTGPQALVLKALQQGSLSAGELATGVSFSLGAVTDILRRLEQRGVINRLRDTVDRHRVRVEATKAGLALVEQPQLLSQERFASRQNSLEEWEQTQLLASLQRIAAMMDAEDIDAAPVLSSGSVRTTPEAVEKVLEPESAPNELLRDDQPSLAKLL